jgi:hypothetical protein
MDLDSVTRMYQRFNLNMRRIGGMVALAFKDERERNPTALLEVTGTSADLLRFVAVFLHASVEDSVRSIVPKGGNFCFYKGTDIDKALKRAGLDSAPLKELYPPLNQLAKRRNRIVHEADMASKTDVSIEEWGAVDLWWLMQWMIAAIAFNYRLITVRAGPHPDLLQRYENAKTAMLKNQEYAEVLMKFPREDFDLQKAALVKLQDLLDATMAAMKPAAPEFLD